MQWSDTTFPGAIPVQKPLDHQDSLSGAAILSTEQPRAYATGLQFAAAPRLYADALRALSWTPLVYDRAYFVELRKRRAVIDRAYRSVWATYAKVSLPEGEGSSGTVTAGFGAIGAVRRHGCERTHAELCR